jgi:DNA repair protein RadC
VTDKQTLQTLSVSFLPHKGRAILGQVRKTIATPADRLTKLVDPDQVAKVKVVYAAVNRILRGDIKQRPVLSSWSAVLDYLRAAMAFEATEQFRLLFLDKRNFLLADEIHQTGTIDHTPVYPREVARRALELGATAIIAVHNHPSGDPTPSQSDVAMTKVLAEALQPLGITVHDHIVIGKQGYASLRGHLA